MGPITNNLSYGNATRPGRNEAVIYPEPAQGGTEWERRGGLTASERGAGPPDHLTLGMATHLAKNEAGQMLEELHQLRSALAPILSDRALEDKPGPVGPTFSAAAAEVTDVVAMLKAARHVIYEITAQLDL